MLPLFLLMACSDDALVDSASLEVATYCDKPVQADTIQVEDGDGDPTSGVVLGRQQTNVVTNVNDPQYGGFVDYLIENRDVGGAAQRGRSDVDGNFTERLGSGNWRIKLGGYQSSYYCAKEFDFSVQAGKVTRACVDMGCAAP
jgi:hypothetical protein